MLDGILGRGFSAKCKSLIKLTRSRIDVIRRKRSATQKFLKKDIADLLSNGLDVNAYGRAEGLLVELRLSSCYDFVDQCCEFLLKHLSAMQKQSDCPEDCRESVSSLMFAAARFSDLPELRDLRQTFQERYGDALEYFLNKEFAEKLSAKPCTMEKKVELMQDIAVEFSIKWNARNFEQRMSNAVAAEQAQPKNCGVFYTFEDKRNVSNGKETSLRGEKIDQPLQKAASDIRKRNDLEVHRDVRRVHSEKEIDFASDRRVRESPSLKPVRSSSSSHRNIDEYGNGGIKPDKLKEKHVVENTTSPSISRDEAHFMVMKPPKSEVVQAKVKIEEDHIKKPRNYAIPPPYVKPNVRKEAILPPYVKPNVRKDAVREAAGSTLDIASENSEKIENLPRPHRRRHSRSRSNQNDDHHHEEDEKKRNLRREDPRKGLQILFDDDRRQNDEEERIIDKLLIHYSKKPSYEEEAKRSSRRSRTRRANAGPSNPESRPERRGSRPEEYEFEVVVPPPPRSISLPRDQPSAPPPEPIKVYARAASFQPDRSDEARHVHPKLPDYDDLAARFAALKGR